MTERPETRFTNRDALGEADQIAGQEDVRGKGAGPILALGVAEWARQLDVTRFDSGSTSSTNGAVPSG
jgi:hypothetical protein